MPDVTPVPAARVSAPEIAPLLVSTVVVPPESTIGIVPAVSVGSTPLAGTSNAPSPPPLTHTPRSQTRPDGQSPLALHATPSGGVGW